MTPDVAAGLLSRQAVMANAALAHIELEPFDTGFSVDAIRRGLSGATLGRLLYVYGAIDSTNARLGQLARAGAPDGTVVLADSQTAARGRRGAPWFSPPGVNLYASVLFRRALAVSAVPVFAFIAPLAVADAVQELGLYPTIEWPNDVLVARKKIAGAWVQCASRGEAIEHVILGVGVNVNVARSALVSALGSAGRFATSLAALTRRVLDRNAVAAAYLRHLDRWAGIYEACGPTDVIAAWRDREILTSCRVEVRLAD